ncbi:hypothetical protein Ae201684P_012124 [Aphanomyces euteiches]|nr:hypothetical protein Ae201684P_012124 [Aphanomyces euteiches]
MAARCSLCQHVYASGVEPATGNDIWLARKMFRARHRMQDSVAAAMYGGMEILSDAHCSADSPPQSVQVCRFCSQFIASNGSDDLKKIDETRHVLLAHSTTRHPCSASLVIRHAAGTSVQADSNALRYLPNDMNRVLAIRPSTSSDAKPVNLQRQQIHETRLFTRESRRKTRAEHPGRRLHAPMLAFPEEPSPPTINLTRAPSAAKRGTLVVKRVGRFQRQEIAFPSLHENKS